MAVREILLPWDQQPQEVVYPDSRWLLRGLSYATLLNGVVGETPVGTNLQSTQWGIGRGFGASGVGTTDKVLLPFTRQAAQRTYIMQCRVTGIGGGGFGRLFEKNTAGTFSEFLAVDFNTVSGGLLWTRNYDTQLGQWISPENSVVGGVQVFAVSYDTSNPSSPVMYVDGRSVTLTLLADPIGSPINNSDQYVIGNRYTDDARWFDGVIGSFYIFDSILLPSEVAELSANMACLWEPQRFWIPLAPAVEPAIAFRSVSSIPFNYRYDIVLPAPADIVDGDILLLAVEVEEYDRAPVTMPPGFTQVSGSPFNTEYAGGYITDLYIATKTVAGDSGDYTCAHSGAMEFCSGLLFAVSGSAGVVQVTRGTGLTDTPITAPGLTTDADNSLVAFISQVTSTSFSSTTPPPGSTPTFIERLDDVGCGVYLATGVLATAGATGNKSHTVPDPGYPWNGLLIEFAPYIPPEIMLLTASAINITATAATPRVTFTR